MPARDPHTGLFQPIDERPARVTIWAERDRLHIAVEHAVTGTRIIEWWDDDAWAMFEAGYFKAGPLGRIDEHWTAPSVLQYCREQGLLTPTGRSKISV